MSSENFHQQAIQAAEADVTQALDDMDASVEAVTLMMAGLSLTDAPEGRKTEKKRGRPLKRGVVDLASSSEEGEDWDDDAPLEYTEMQRAAEMKWAGFRAKAAAKRDFERESKRQRESFES